MCMRGRQKTKLRRKCTTDSQQFGAKISINKGCLLCVMNSTVVYACSCKAITTQRFSLSRGSKGQHGHKTDILHILNL
jgi:hypothetical protein